MTRRVNAKAIFFDLLEAIKELKEDEYFAEIVFFYSIEGSWEGGLWRVITKILLNLTVPIGAYSALQRRIV